MKTLMAQILRFGIVGGTAFVIDYGVMVALTEIFGINYLVSSGISFCVSVIYNYVLSTHWVFDVAKKRKKSEEFVVFLVLSIIGLGINELLMWLLVDKAKIIYLLSKIFATAIVMVYNFITRKVFLEN
ncbi:GtrA family protein [Ruminococcus sp. 5_1_39BFAA]|uniref:GtrA family protein n=1 Tax=Ruminococcus sp. 5_1_39BFAA TaxID=457412 RepID=UPI003564B78A